VKPNKTLHPHLPEHTKSVQGFGQVYYNSDIRFTQVTWSKQMSDTM
jgi:hypothetical protein